MERPSIDMSGTIVVLVFFLMILALYHVFYELALNAPRLSAATTFMLLVVTYLYLQTTNKIADETEKDRKVRFIEKRLEKLYCPLEERLDRFEPSGDLGLLATELQISFAKYSYLASDEFAPIWKKFTKRPLPYLHQDMLKQIKRDIKKYEEELHNLTRC